MHAGELRWRLELQQKTTTNNDLGEAIDTWSAVDCYKSLPVHVQELTGSETEHADRVQARITHEVTSRYLKSTTPTPQMRFKWGTRILNIEAVLNKDGKRQWHTFLCTEVADG